MDHHDDDPVLDDDGLLRVGDRWVAIPDRQLAVVALLVRRAGRLVRTDELATAYGTTSAATVSTVVSRLRVRVAAVGLRLHAIRGRGVILDRA